MDDNRQWEELVIYLASQIPDPPADDVELAKKVFYAALQFIPAAQMASYDADKISAISLHFSTKITQAVREIAARSVN